MTAVRFGQVHWLEPATFEHFRLTVNQREAASPSDPFDDSNYREPLAEITGDPQVKQGNYLPCYVKTDDKKLGLAVFSGEDGDVFQQSVDDHPEYKQEIAEGMLFRAEGDKRLNRICVMV